MSGNTMETWGDSSGPGAETVNGHAPRLVPFTVRRLGPVAAWPRRARLPRPLVDGDVVLRVLAAAVVLAVAAFGAIVSYSHIFTLGRIHGQDGTAARLLPLSVDGLIAAASLVMLLAARRKQPVPRLARAMLITGVIATVAANILDGLPAAWIGPAVSAVIGAAISAWPAVAFIGCAEMAIQSVRDGRRAAAADDTEDDTEGDTGGDSGGDRDRDTAPPPKPPRGRQRKTGEQRARAILKAHADWPDDKVAKQAGVSLRTVQRAKRPARLPA